jgi:hypothetical protein
MKFVKHVQYVTQTVEKGKRSIYLIFIQNIVLKCSNIFFKFMFLVYMLKRMGLASKNNATSFTAELF